MNSKPIYINGLGSISIQQPLSFEGIQQPLSYQTPHVRCVEPNYKDFFDAVQARRLSKIIKRAIVTAKQAVDDSGISMPDAIVTGTGLGCVEDTEKFLDAMIRNEEKFLQPTFFIQSTHNTISSQIAIHMNCKGYNNTYIHRGVSFENALLDAYLLFQRGTIRTALVTGNDEMTPNYFILLGRIGYWKQAIQNTRTCITQEQSNGSFAGEGSVSIMFSDTPSSKSYACLNRMSLLYKPVKPMQQIIREFVADCGLNIDDIDVCMTGMNADIENDAVYNSVLQDLFSPNAIGTYKHICGEYYTSLSYGMLLSAYCIQQGIVPAHCILGGVEKSGVKHILLYNHFRNRDHSLMLLSTC
ncbi:MAG TPA: beta-ketoacyl synthase chain length factor [Bacteroidales bacterium]|nr:beta-ketoacyl synthase chain length factor [Bacteroidales bacterium]